MRAFVFVSCFIALAIARPEAGYSYSPPAPPAPPVAPPAPAYGAPPPPSYSSYSDSSVVGASYSVGGAEQYSSGGAFDSGSHYADTGANYNTASYSSGSAISGGSAFDTGFGGGPAQTVVQKHIYVHVPPPEPEQHHGHHHGGPAPVNQKHYKIIFIKAPSAPSGPSAAQIAAQQSVSEEKTIVYVLVKKPDDIDAAGGAFAVPQAPPSKPEVYFIKYKTQGAGSSSGGQIGSGSGIVGQPHQAYGPPH